MRPSQRRNSNPPERRRRELKSISACGQAQNRTAGTRNFSLLSD